MKRAVWVGMTYLALLVAGLSGTYILADPSVFHPLFQAKFITHLAAIRWHALTGCVALALGPFLFLPGPRRVHRFLGRIYLGCVLVSASTGLRMSLIAYGGPVPQTQFTVLSFLWLVSALMAYGTVRAGRIEEHRRWMGRNYALTWGTVATRVCLHGLQELGCPLDPLYQLVGLPWVPCLVAGELLLSRPARRPPPA